MLFHDLRYSVRSLLRSPGLTLTALLTLALGIGANTALFSLINGVLWSAPPGVRQAEELVWLNHTSDRWGSFLGGFALPEYRAYRIRSDLFEGLAAFAGTPTAVSGSGLEPVRVNAEIVSDDYFSVLRMRPALGRGFLPEENRTPGTHPVAVISHDLWRTRFGSDPDIIGKPVKVNGSPFTVVGVAPSEFHGLADMEEPTDLWVPLMMSGQAMPVHGEFLDKPGSGMLTGVGRLRGDISLDQASRALETITFQLAADDSTAYHGVRQVLTPFRGSIGARGGGGVVPTLALAMGVTMVVLLIACANVANLMLARAAGRRREIAIRAAIGASRWGIVRQLLVESVTLSVVGGLLGLLLAVWMIALFTKLAPLPFPIPIALDATALWATLGLALGTGVLVGVVPALRASRPQLIPELKDGAGGGRRGMRAQRGLVAVQLALCFMLLVGGGMLLRGLREAMVADRALPARDESLALSFDLGVQGYSDEAAREIQLLLLEKARALPGVVSASMAPLLPFEGGVMSRQLVVQGQETGATQLSLSDFFVRHEVWPDFFRTVGIPVLRGRDFAMGDRKGSPGVVIVNEAAARRYWPDGDALGALVRVDSDTAAWKTVIGIVGDAGVRRAGENTPMIYAPELQVGAIFSRSTLVIRTRGRARDLAGPLRAVIRDVNPDLPVFDVRTLGEVIDRRRLPGQIGSTLLAIFGALALGLAVIGLHGVIAFTVVQRTREVGVRIALGATRRNVLSLFGRDALRMAFIGIAAGLVLAIGAGRVLSHVAKGVQPADPFTIAGIALLLLAVTLLASYLPARRATRVDPVVALRAE